MAQLVGRACAICGGRIATVAEGGFCKTCRASVHRECARRADKASAGACAACGAPAAPAPLEPPHVTQQATPGEVRGFAVIMIALGLVLVFVFEDHVFVPSRIPVPWLGYLAIVFSLVMLVYPDPFRERVSRVMRTRGKWIPPPAPARAAAPRAPAGETFEGAYAPPVFTSEQRPFPLRGQGRLALRPHGLEVTGTRLLTVSSPGFILIAVLIPVVGAVVFFTAGVPGLAVLLALVVAFVILLRRRQHAATIVIPWEKLHGFLGDPKGRAVRILVRQMDPSGEIWFVPADGPAPLLAALLERGAPEETDDLGL